MRLIASVLLIAISGLAVANEHRDGNWWQQQNEMAKTYYVLGMLDGMTLGHSLSSLGATTPAEKDAMDKANTAYGEAVAKYLHNVTVKQLMDGMTSLYADYKNRRIDTEAAMWLVMLGISGTPQQLLDIMTEQWRQTATQAQGPPAQ
jgi:hypothetical protein